MRISAPTDDSTTQPLHLMLREHGRKKLRKPAEGLCLQKWQGNYIHEIATIWLPKHASVEGGSLMGSHPLVEEPQAINIYCEWGN